MHVYLGEDLRLCRFARGLHEEEEKGLKGEEVNSDVTTYLPTRKEG